MKFGIDHHATMYALLSKAVQQSCPEEGRTVLEQATLRYGRERGRRMAEQAMRDGVPLTLENYFAYVEWTDEDHEMERGIAQYVPIYQTTVYRCGWVESWKKRGLLEYGKVYCEYADYGLVSGFNPENLLKLEDTLSHGQKTCNFIWKGYAMDAERSEALRCSRERVGQQYQKTFLYHTGHLYSCLRDEFQKKLGNQGLQAAEHALAEFSEIFGPEAADVVKQNCVIYEVASG